MTSQGSYLNRRLRSTNLLLVALMLLVLPQSGFVSRQWSHTPAGKPQRHVFFTLVPLHLALVFSSFSGAQSTACPQSGTNIRSLFHFLLFFKNVRLLIFHPKVARPPSPVSKCVTFRKNCELMKCSLSSYIWFNMNVSRNKVGWSLKNSQKRPSSVNWVRECVGACAAVNSAVLRGERFPTCCTPRCSSTQKCVRSKGCVLKKGTNFDNFIFQLFFVPYSHQVSHGFLAPWQPIS